jgi:ThiF family
MGSLILVLPGPLAARLHAHLFPGDGDEHAAVIGACIARTSAGRMLLARDLALAKDGSDYVPGQRGYRMLTGPFVTEQVLRCRSADLIYLAVHNHAGRDSVEFSEDDLASQRRGYPALLDIMSGSPVGALVFAANAMAGRLWISPDHIEEFTEARIVDRTIMRLYPRVPSAPPRRPPAYDRQARIFGDRGQDLLNQLTVGIVGAGGAGSLLVEYLARLGVGHFIIIDPERLEPTNVPRITGATNWDAMTWLRQPRWPAWIRTVGERFSASKVRVMRRLIRRANPNARVLALHEDFVDDHVARQVTSCDYLFLAADSMQARLVFNAIVHAYLIPGVQVGAKVPVDRDTGEVGSVFATSRIVTPSSGCLWCNGLITSAGLQREAETAAERRSQRYVDEPFVVAPSVITLNALAAAQAANDFLFAVTGMVGAQASQDYVRFLPRERVVKNERPRRDAKCPHCSTQGDSLLARGDGANLPTRYTSDSRNKP